MYGRAGDFKYLQKHGYEPGDKRSLDVPDFGAAQCAAYRFWHISQAGKMGGAGTLVPITGFANSVAAPAIEYQKEGQVFGIGCKIFTIAGPVILYGILTSYFLGLVYYFLHLWGIV